jgi:hypothetical protein
MNRPQDFIQYKNPCHYTICKKMTAFEYYDEKIPIHSQKKNESLPIILFIDLFTLKKNGYANLKPTSFC